MIGSDPGLEIPLPLALTSADTRPNRLCLRNRILESATRLFRLIESTMREPSHCTRKHGKVSAANFACERECAVGGCESLAVIALSVVDSRDQLQGVRQLRLELESLR